MFPVTGCKWFLSFFLHILHGYFVMLTFRLIATTSLLNQKRLPDSPDSPTPRYLTPAAAFSELAPWNLRTPRTQRQSPAEKAPEVSGLR